MLVDVLKSGEVVVPIGDFHILKGFKVNVFFSFCLLQLFEEIRKAFYLLHAAFDEDFICSVTEELRFWSLLTEGFHYFLFQVSRKVLVLLWPP